MVAKHSALGSKAPDGSLYVTVTDGAGNLGGPGNSPFLPGATPITVSATGTTGATAATLTGASGKTTYIAGWNISSDATAAAVGAATVAGTVSGTLTYRQGTGATPATVQTSQNYNPPIPASATNTSIVVTSAAAGTGGNVAVNAWGYRL